MKLVFFVNIIRQARCIRRIEDFIKNGYDVDVYGFDREGDNRKLPQFLHSIIGVISRSSSYLRRLLMMKRAMSRVMSQQDGDTIYYIFSLDVALAFMLNGGWRRRYIYEVSDLMELEVGNALLSKILMFINRYIINHSLETIMTSPGFASFYYGQAWPFNISIVPNKLNTKCLELPLPRNRTFDVDNITIGFTGAIRNRAIYNFIETVGREFPNIKIHFHGIFTDDKVYGAKIREAIDKYPNIEYFGPFKNPDDFPEIYSNIDMVLSLYTAEGNDKVLEPNKLYEAIYYEKPIIVSKGTYTGDYVDDRNVGYTVDGDDCDDICDLLRSITPDNYNERVASCALIPKKYLIDNTTELFDKLQTVLK